MTVAPGRSAPVVPLSPRVIEAERAIVAAISLDAEIWSAARDLVQLEDLTDPACIVAWSAALALDADGIAVEYVGLAARMRELGAESPDAWLALAHEGTPSFARWEDWCAAIRRTAALRRAAQEATDTAQRVAKDGAADAIAAGAERLAKLAADLSPAKHALDSAACVEALVRRYDATREAREHGRSVGIPTGFESLDALVGGWRPGQLVVIGARPSVGKSSLASQFLLAAGGAGVASLLFSLEMGRDEIMMRMASQLGVPFGPLYHGSLRPWDEEVFTEALERLRRMPFWVDERGALHAAEIASQAAAHHRRQPLGLVVVDYLQLCRAERRRTDTREAEVAEISRSLKALAKRLGCTVVALSQLSRKGEDVGRPPQLSDLRESGAIEQDADVVIFLHRRRRVDSPTLLDEQAEVLVAKQRNGPQGRCMMRFQGDRVRFVEDVQHAA